MIKPKKYIFKGLVQTLMIFLKRSLACFNPTSALTSSYSSSTKNGNDHIYSLFHGKIILLNSHSFKQAVRGDHGLQETLCARPLPRSFHSPYSRLKSLQSGPVEWGLSVYFFQV